MRFGEPQAWSSYGSAGPQSLDQPRSRWSSCACWCRRCTARPVREGGLALGWIYFDESTPGHRIYVSYANVQQLMLESRGVIGSQDRMPIFEREVLLSRALGRALAHELGHYFLASKAHTDRGLMKAHRTASEFFGPDERPFKLDGAQRSLITARLARESVVVSR